MPRRESAQYAAQHIMGAASGPYDYLPYFYRHASTHCDCTSPFSAFSDQSLAARAFMPMVVNTSLGSERTAGALLNHKLLYTKLSLVIKLGLGSHAHVPALPSAAGSLTWAGSCTASRPASRCTLATRRRASSAATLSRTARRASDCQPSVCMGEG